MARANVLSTIALLCLLASCYQPEVAIDEAPDARDASLPHTRELGALLEAAADAGTNAPIVCEPDPSPLRKLLVSVRTVSIGGRFRPRNAGAIWIEDADGAFVKTLERWGVRRAKWLTAFNESSDGDVTDAVTSATLPEHRVHELSWDLTDRSGCEIQNGAYALRLEIADMSATGENIRIPFEKAAAPAELAPPDAAGFRNMALRLE